MVPSTTTKQAAPRQQADDPPPAGPAAAGLLFSTLIVYFLASSNEAPTTLRGALLSNVDTIIDAAVPLTTTDVIAVTLGEALAGWMGALASWILSLTFLQTSSSKTQNAVADGDFLLAKAAVQPLVSNLGIPSVGAVFLAMVPYQLVKLGSQNWRQVEDAELERLLEEQQQEGAGGAMPQWMRKLRMVQASTNFVDPETLKPVREAKDSILVELFTDLIKWLEYDVLTTEYSGKLTWNSLPLPLGVEGAAFGVVSAVSSQVYADMLYAYFGWGGQVRQKAVQERTLNEWIVLIVSRCVYAATLFGVYEIVQIPAKGIIAALLSGGADGCYGSADYNLCIESYLVSNPPPKASLEAELRSLITALVSFWNRVMPTTWDIGV